MDAKKSLLFILSQCQTPVELVSIFHTRLRETVKDAIYAHQFAKARNSATIAVKYKVPTYNKGDLFWANRSYMEGEILREQKFYKLDARRSGAFQILKIVSQNAFCLAIPSKI